MVRELDFVDECYKDKDLSLLKKLTLVIPTYNRNYYLSRCLWYHAHFPFGQIIVADSSPEEKKVINRETVKKIREIFSVNILYLEYQPETEKYGGDIYRKWGDAIQHVETEYSQICTDKDFFIPSTLASCIAYLDTHNDCGLGDGEYYLAMNLVGDVISYLPALPTKFNISNPDPLSRYYASISKTNASTNLQAIRKSKLHKYTYNKLIDVGIHDLRFGEFIPELLSIIKSKEYYIPNELYTVRDGTQLFQNKSYNKSNSSTSRYPNLKDYISAGIFNNYFENAVSCLIDEFISNGVTSSRDELHQILSKTLPPMLKKRGFYGDDLIRRMQNSPLFSKCVLTGLSLLSKTPIKNVTNRLIKVCIGLDISGGSEKYLDSISIIKYIIQSDKLSQSGDTIYVPPKTSR